MEMVKIGGELAVAAITAQSGTNLGVDLRLPIGFPTFPL